MGDLKQNPTSEVHIRRYFRSKRESVEAIAQDEKVDESTIKNSIRAVELYRDRHNVEVLNQAVVGTVMDVMPEVKKSIRRQLLAKNGKKQDFETQRAAVAEVRGFIQTVQPKSPNVHATQVNLGGQPGQPRIATGSYVGMEDRLKAITQELETQRVGEPRRQLTQAPLQAVEDGEYEDGESEEAEPVETQV